MHRSLILIAAFVSSVSLASESKCYGKPSNGKIENSVQLPLQGKNFSAYSELAAALGRTHVHSRVAAVIQASYAAVASNFPSTKFVYGETGWPSGGRFRPHRTHQNDLSVDFFVPVKNSQGVSVPLPTLASQRFGYDVEFNASGHFEQYSIDFDALGEHLYQLDVAAKQQGIGIALAIFDDQYLPRLFSTKHGKYLQDNIPFMKGKPWVRHDEHYHIDFAVPCKPNAA